MGNVWERSLPDPAELYVAEDNCTTGQCSAEAAFIPQNIGNYDLDALFAGLEVDTTCDLGIATVGEEIRSDELFPLIIPEAPITLEGVMDVFARRHPERAQLLDMLINGEGYEVEFVEYLSEEEAALEQAIDDDFWALQRITLLPGGGILYNRDEYNEIRKRRNDNRYRLANLQNWRIADRKILITTRINKNIDKFNWAFGMDDDDLIFEDISNADGAQWLFRVMGDWMVRSGIPGAGPQEEFMDSWSSRVIWGSLNVIVGAAEVIGGIVVGVGASWTGVGLLAGGAMTIAGIEALTQGIDMLRTPVQSAHQRGWLGDAAFAMGESFGILDQSDQAAFNKYWAFTMLGLSLGGAGVSAFLPAAKVTMQGTRTTRNLSYLARTYDRTVDAARLTMVGIKNARFGRVTVNFATMPSGRIMMNIKGVGRVVAERWESIPRLRLRLTTGRKQRLLERYRKLHTGKAGLAALRGGISNSNQARVLVYDVARRMGISGPDLDELVSSIKLGAPGDSSAFRISNRSLRIADDIGYARYLDGYVSTQFNELIAIKEVAHEIGHAQRFARWLRKGGSADDFWAKYGRNGPNQGKRYYVEEISIERGASEVLDEMIEPRITHLNSIGQTEEANRLADLLRISKADSEAYIQIQNRYLGQ
ncbi:MAG: hypothetical protein AAFY25_06690 [Pseudomonadota bacterium]